MTYTFGQTLNLAGMQVTLFYNDGTTRDIAAANFGTEGITVAPVSGTTLNMGHHNTTISASISSF